MKQSIPRPIWALGFVSLLMDASSEAIHSLLPVFVVVTLGASPIALGLLEGIAEATAAVLKAFSGVISDRMARRKPLAVAGYGLSALSKPLFAIAGSLGLVFTARIIDRVGKGIRGAPRDALVADLSPDAIRGACYGLRQALDTVGAFAGPLLAMALMALFAGDIRTVFWVSTVPALICVAVLVKGVQEPPRTVAKAGAGASLTWSGMRDLGPAYWRTVGLGVLFMLARFSEAFLVVAATEQGFAATWVPAVFVVMNITYAAGAYPAGALSDRVGRHGLLALGCAVLITADLVLAFGSGALAVLAGVALWGVHLALTEGLLVALVADAAPAAARGTAFGVFHLLRGGALLAASVVAGALWQFAGAGATFLTGAALATAALVVAAAHHHRSR